MDVSYVVWRIINFIGMNQINLWVFDCFKSCRKFDVTKPELTLNLSHDVEDIVIISSLIQNC
jgi:hypothetical protein